MFGILADITLIIHLVFIVFAIFGAFLVLKWKYVAWVHVPAFLWAALIELCGWICPLTPLEQWFRIKSGGASYQAGFIEHYLLPLIYPGMLTRSIQIVLGLLVLCLNLMIYTWIMIRITKKKACHE